MHIVTGLIPLYRISLAATLVVFQGIGKRGGVAAEREIITGVWGKHNRARHIETMQVTLK